MISILLFILIPLLISALIHHFLIIPRNYLSFLSTPIDHHRLFLGKPLLGDTKTWRGLIVTTVSTTILSWVCSLFLHPDPIYLKFNSLTIGLICGLFYSIGELPTSFLKRRLGLSPSHHLHGVVGICLYLLEQSDSIIAVTVAVFLIINTALLPSSLIIFGGLTGIFLHIIIDYFLYLFGYKANNQRPFLFNPKATVKTSSLP